MMENDVSTLDLVIECNIDSLCAVVLQLPKTWTQSCLLGGTKLPSDASKGAEKEKKRKRAAQDQWNGRPSLLQ